MHHHLLLPQRSSQRRPPQGRFSMQLHILPCLFWVMMISSWLSKGVVHGNSLPLLLSNRGGSGGSNNNNDSVDKGSSNKGSTPFGVVGKTAQSARNIIRRRRLQQGRNVNHKDDKDEKEKSTITVAEKEGQDDTATSKGSNNNHNDHQDANSDNTQLTTSNTSSNSIPQQPSIRLKPRIVSLNVMIAGLSGLGKTTTCASLLDAWQQQQPEQQQQQQPQERYTSKVQSSNKSRSTSSISPKTLHVDPSRQYKRFDAQENTWVHVRIIDTPGFGNRIDHRDAVRPILKYIHKCRRQHYRFETSPTKFLLSSSPFMKGKTGTKIHSQTNDNNNNNNNHHHHHHYQVGHDENNDDTLVHVCLYFLSPGRLLEMDVYFLKQIQKEVCIVPIIAKADTMTNEELANFRSEIVQTFAKEGIVPYNFDTMATTSHRDQYSGGGGGGGQYRLDGGSHSNLYQRGRRFGEALAIVSRNGIYPWGEVRSFHPIHSDLLLVRDLLLSHHTERFVELATVKYGQYRAQQIHSRKRNDVLKYMLLSFLACRTLGIPIPATTYMSTKLEELLAWISPSTLSSSFRSLLSNMQDQLHKMLTNGKNQPEQLPPQASSSLTIGTTHPQEGGSTHKDNNDTRQRQRFLPWQPRQQQQQQQEKDESMPSSIKSTSAKDSTTPKWFLWLGGTESE